MYNRPLRSESYYCCCYYNVYEAYPLPFYCSWEEGRPLCFFCRRFWSEKAETSGACKFGMYKQSSYFQIYSNSMCYGVQSYAAVLSHWLLTIAFGEGWGGTNFPLLQVRTQSHRKVNFLLQITQIVINKAWTQKISRVQVFLLSFLKDF